MDETTSDAQRKRRLQITGGLILAAIVIVAIVIVASSGGSNTTSKAPTSTTNDASGLKSVSAVASEFAGIPQKGNELGSQTAPATMMVFADMQCPFCAEFENNAMPTLVQRYVRPGKLKIVFQPIAILGNDSTLGARAVAAAAQQQKLFEYAALLYRNQGEENTGYMTQAYLQKIGHGVKGLDVAKMTAALKSAPVNKLLGQAQTIATAGKVQSTPTFFVAKKGATLQSLPVSDLTPGAFTPALDKLTR